MIMMMIVICLFIYDVLCLLMQNSNRMTTGAIIKNAIRYPIFANRRMRNEDYAFKKRNGAVPQTVK